MPPVILTLGIVAPESPVVGTSGSLAFGIPGNPVLEHPEGLQMTPLQLGPLHLGHLRLGHLHLETLSWGSLQQWPLGLGPLQLGPLRLGSMQEGRSLHCLSQWLIPHLDIQLSYN